MQLRVLAVVVAFAAVINAAVAVRADLPVDIDFSEIAAGTTYGVTTPAFMVEGVEFRMSAYQYWVGEEPFELTFDTDGVAEVQLAPTDFAIASGNALHTARFTLIMDFAGEAARIEFDYLDREPRVYDSVWSETYNINLGVQEGSLDTYVPSFREYAEFGGGIPPASSLSSDMFVTETVLPSGDVYGHVTLDAWFSYSGYIIGGRDLWIDNLSVTPIPEPSGLMLAAAAAGLLLRRRRAKM